MRKKKKLLYHNGDYGKTFIIKHSPKLINHHDNKVNNKIYNINKINGNRNISRNINKKENPYYRKPDNIVLPKLGKKYENNIKEVFNYGLKNSYKSEYNRKYFM